MAAEPSANPCAIPGAPRASEESSAAAAIGDLHPSASQASRDQSTLAFAPHETGIATPGGQSVTECPSASQPPSVAERLGHYRLLSELGRGGMGIVYKAVQENLGRTVALKTITHRRIRNREAIERFRHEAAAAGQLEHPGIVQVHELAEQDGQFYFSMQFIEGEGLDHKLTRGPLPPREAARIVQAAAEAVNYAHRRGVIHRDLKPANILIDAAGRPRITDFGLAKRLEADSDLTQEGQIIGTPHYMSPEQAAGATAQVGAMSDLYSLGATLYALLTGRPPFQAYDAVEVIRQVREQEPLSPRALNPQVPKDLENICLRCLAKSPPERERCYGSVGELAADLDRFLRDEAVKARPVGRLERWGRWSHKTWRQRKRWVLASAALLVLAAASLGIAVIIAQRADETSRVAEVQRRFEAGLDAAESWSPKRFQALRQIVDEYAAVAPQEGGIARERLQRRFADAVLAMIRERQPSPQAIEQIELALQLLDDDAPQLATEVRKEFESRVTTTETLSPLEPPYSALAEFFSSGVTSQGQALVRPTMEADAAPNLLSTAACSGDVRLDAHFDPSWRAARELGLILNGGPDGGYEFLLIALQPGGDVNRTTTFQQAQTENSQAALVIRRGGKTLRTRIISATSLGEDPLALSARREGLRLSFQVNGNPTMAFYDVFPLADADAGVFGLHWPGGVGLTRLYASRQAVPGVLSLLGDGDRLYLQGDYPAARTYYQRQAIAFAGTSSAEEARVKEALCLIALKQPEVALELLQAAVDDSSDTAESDRLWHDVATTQLLLQYARVGQTEEAATLVQRMALRRAGQAGALDYAAVTTDDMQRELLGLFRVDSGGLSLWLRDDQRAQRFEMAVELEELLQVPESYRVYSRVDLMRALRIAGDSERALAIARARIQKPPADSTPDFDAMIIREYGWLSRTALPPGPARRTAVNDVIGEIERRFVAVGVVDVPDYTLPGMLKLYVERVRCRIELGQGEQASRELDAMLDRIAPGASVSGYYREFSDACILRGFLHDPLGRSPQAKAAFARASFPADVRDPALFGELAGGIGVVNVLIAGALSETMSDDEIAAFAQRLIEKYVPAYFPTSLALGEAAKMGVRPAMLRDMWTTSRGREAARRFVFQDLPYLEYHRLPPVLLTSQIVYATAFDGPPSAEQEAFVWESMDRGCASVFDRRLELQLDHALFAAFTWRGTNQWSQFAERLDEDLRGRAAYLFGLRYKRLGKPNEAKVFFDLALGLAGDNQELTRLVKQELGALAAAPAS